MEPVLKDLRQENIRKTSQSKASKGFAQDLDTVCSEFFNKPDNAGVGDPQFTCQLLARDRDRHVIDQTVKNLIQLAIRWS